MKQAPPSSASRFGGPQAKPKTVWTSRGVWSAKSASVDDPARKSDTTSGPRVVQGSDHCDMVSSVISPHGFVLRCKGLLRQKFSHEETPQLISKDGKNECAL